MTVLTGYAGLDFFITEIPDEVFTHSETTPMAFLTPRTNIYPYLLVNIGSGVSMIKVSGPREYQRIGGTSLGGGTLWGLLSLITGARTFDDMLAMAEKGDNTNVDMLVGDIYGSGYGKIGLKAETIASSFGKVYKTKRKAEREAEDGGGLTNGDWPDHGGMIGMDDMDGDVRRPAFKPEDICRSLLYAVRYARCRREGESEGGFADVLQLQYWPDCLPAIVQAQPGAHLFRRLLHTWPPADYEHVVLRHHVLVWRREAGLLSPPRRLFGGSRSISQAAA